MNEQGVWEKAIDVTVNHQRFVKHELNVFAVICRIMSGVHWISDIIGGALISLSLVLTYRALIKTPMKINTGAVL